MKKNHKVLRKTGVFLGNIFLGTMASLAVYLSFYGMVLFGLPEAEDVVKAEFFYPEASGEALVLTEEEDIKQAVQLTGCLRYSLFGGSETDSTPEITVTYTLKNGETVSVSASRDTVWWKGKSHALKQEELFVNLTEGLFFSEK